MTCLVQPEMISKQGYPVETHEVTTEDGYILQMHRIPFGKKSPPEEGVVRPAIYLQHGLLCSSTDYVMGIPEKGLGTEIGGGEKRLCNC